MNEVSWQVSQLIEFEFWIATMARLPKHGAGFSEDTGSFEWETGAPKAGNGTYIRGRLGDGGRLVIPSELRKELDLSTGDDVVMTVRNGVLEIVPQMHAVRRVQAQMALLKRPGVDEVDAFLAERRAESRAEDDGEEAAWWLKKGKTE